MEHDEQLPETPREHDSTSPSPGIQPESEEKAVPLVAKKSRGGEKEKETSWVRENVEAIIVAIVLALIIRQFVMEAFVIPTGSMAPTLFGEHLEVSCPNCSREFAIDNPDKGGTRKSFDHAYKSLVKCPRCEFQGTSYLYDPGPYSENTEALCSNCAFRWVVENPLGGRMVLAKRISVNCPNCSYEFQKDITPSGISGGHKILVNKSGLLVRPLRRWDIIVFKYPEDTSKNYIKRLIGLPNEKILIDEGDIYVNGKIARKELDVIRAMSYEIFNSELQQRWEKLIPWQSYDDCWDLSVQALDVKEHSDESQVDFTKDITAALPYSDADSTRGVNDVGIRFSVNCKNAGEVFCIIDDCEHAFRLNLPAGTEGKASITMDNSEIMSADIKLVPGKSHVVEFLDIDDRVIALLDGKEIFRHDFDSDIEVSGTAQISLGTIDSAARFERIRVYRDIYYTREGQHAVTSTLELGPHEYFALGDNSASSKDSRRWGTVPAQNMLGRAFIIFWPIPQIRFIK